MTGGDTVAPRYLQVNITPELTGRTVDSLLRRHLQLSGTVIRRIKWLEDGITVDGKRVTVRHKVCEGETLSVRLTDPSSAEQPVPTEGPLDLLYEFIQIRGFEINLAVAGIAPNYRSARSVCDLT